jgi:hypothetical protein
MSHRAFNSELRKAFLARLNFGRTLHAESENLGRSARAFHFGGDQHSVCPSRRAGKCQDPLISWWRVLDGLKATPQAMVGMAIISVNSDLLITDQRLAPPRDSPAGTRRIHPTVRLDAHAGLAAVLAFAAAAIGGLTTALTFAGVLSLTAIVSGLATALTLTVVLTFASMFSCIGIDEIVDGSTGCAGDARCIRPHSDGTGEEPGNCRSRDDRFR